MPWPEAGTLVDVLTLCPSVTQAVELVEHALFRPFGEVVREVAPQDAGTVGVQDRVRDVAQVVPGRPAEIQSPAAARESPGSKHRLDQLPARIGQITRIRTSLRHTSEAQRRTECAQGHSDGGVNRSDFLAGGLLAGDLSAPGFVSA